MKKNVILTVCSVTAAAAISMTGASLNVSKAVAEERQPELNCDAYGSSEPSTGMGDDDDFGMGGTSISPMKSLCQFIEGVNTQVVTLRNLLVAQQQTLTQLNQAVANLQSNSNTSNSAPACQGGELAIRRNGSNHCYIGFNAPANFETASKACNDIGGYLVTITSVDENDFVVKNFAPRDQGGNGKEIWIGFTDRRFESENPKGINKWEWVNGEVQIAGDSIFNRFSANEPNNGSSKDNEDCAAIHSSRGGQWDDKECSSQRAYVCERDR